MRKLFYLVGCFITSSVFASTTLYLGAIVENQDSMIPYYLNSIDNIDYEKNNIILELASCNPREEVDELVQTWIDQHKQQYKQIFYSKQEAPNTQLRQLFATIKDHFLDRSQELGAEYCLILSSDAYLFPHTVKHLISKNKPVIAPMLRPVPQDHDLHRNFFADVQPNGYYKDHPEYYHIAQRQKTGTFKVPCVHSAYLIQTNFAKDLSFSKGFATWELIAFSNNARLNDVDQYICNEREFGEILHFSNTLSDEELRSFSLVHPEAKITLDDAKSILSSLEDPQINAFLQTFNPANYAIYRVKNKDLYLVDDNRDPIKNSHLKENANWGTLLDFAKYAKPGSSVIDVGSYVGINAIALSQTVGDSGKVYAFEPQVKPFCELAINVHLNNCHNVILQHKALGAENKLVSMRQPADPFALWRHPEFAPPEYESLAVVTELTELNVGNEVEMKTLDDYKLKNVSLIHISVGGNENAIIQGARKTISINKPTLLIEIPQDINTFAKVKGIERLGYSYTSLNNNYYLFTPKKAPQPLAEYTETKF